ncbi:hypothetical protein M1403_02505 [Patescibacteria group bacterium]|nr:hypothetical protein [Patescibacteria group bacterium]
MPERDELGSILHETQDNMGKENLPKAPGPKIGTPIPSEPQARASNPLSENIMRKNNQEKTPPSPEPRYSSEELELIRETEIADKTNDFFDEIATITTDDKGRETCTITDSETGDKFSFAVEANSEEEYYKNVAAIRFAAGVAEHQNKEDIANNLQQEADKLEEKIKSTVQKPPAEVVPPIPEPAVTPPPVPPVPNEPQGPENPPAPEPEKSLPENPEDDKQNALEDLARLQQMGANRNTTLDNQQMDIQDRLRERRQKNKGKGSRTLKRTVAMTKEALAATRETSDRNFHLRQELNLWDYYIRNADRIEQERATITDPEKRATFDKKNIPPELRGEKTVTSENPNTIEREALAVIPRLIKVAHREQILAGSKILETNTPEAVKDALDLEVRLRETQAQAKAAEEQLAQLREQAASGQLPEIKAAQEQAKKATETAGEATRKVLEAQQERNREKARADALAAERQANIAQTAAAAKADQKARDQETIDHLQEELERTKREAQRKEDEFLDRMTLIIRREKGEPLTVDQLDELINRGLINPDHLTYRERVLLVDSYPDKYQLITRERIRANAEKFLENLPKNLSDFAKNNGELLALFVGGAGLRMILSHAGADLYNPDILNMSLAFLGFSTNVAIRAAEQNPETLALEAKHPIATRRIKRFAAGATAVLMGWSAESIGEHALSGLASHLTAETQPAETTTPTHSPTAEPTPPPGKPSTAGTAVPTPPKAETPPVSPTPGATPPVGPEVTGVPPVVPPGIEHLIAPNGAVINGSVVNNTLTYNGEPWHLLDNGSLHLHQLAGGEMINETVLAEKLQEAVNLWSRGELSAADHPDLWAIFQISNGTQSVFNNLMNHGSAVAQAMQHLSIIK